MCGIAGMILADPLSNQQEVLQRMTSAIQHRGPDHEGIFWDGHTGLGHRRLAILDLSSAGNQPMVSYDGRYVIAHNGEVYNFREMRKELAEYPFTTETDTEVILAAYAKWGVGCLQRFQGMFAFAIWDKEKKQLLIARDRMGIKPLYYHLNGKQLLFSSEIRSLLASELVPRKADEASVLDYLRYQTVHAPRTIIRNVNMLMPGSYMTCANGQTTIESYANEPAGESLALTYEQTCTGVRERFFKAVEKRLVADVPFGAFLSGGIDSTAVVAAMSQLSNTSVKTFSVVFEEQDFSEEKYAGLIARRYQTDHHEIRVRPEDFLHELPDALNAMDHPGGDGPNTYTVSKRTKQAGITMALSGLGGDEVFAGYPVFQRLYKLNANAWLYHVPRVLRKVTASALQGSVQRQKMARLLTMKTYDPAAAYALGRQLWSDEDLYSLYSGNWFENTVEEITRPEFNNGRPFLTKVSRAEMFTYMQNVLLRDTDQMSMAHALEVRVPFLDHELVSFVAQVPDKHKYPSTPKKLLTDSLGELIPEDISNRPKMGFTFPWERWMKNELKDFSEQHLNLLGDQRGFDKQGLDRVWKDFLAQRGGVTWTRIWPLVVLAYWLDKHDVDV
ncbi:MAG: asparagine synthase (glutamine-hydrolyzing) [Flavobacteriales bacterium]|nr:asparagine synthase (glutamine-hydrolyzing) [Flavobacteriales bacterium]